MEMQIGIDSFAAANPDPSQKLELSPAQRMSNLLGEITLADSRPLMLWRASSSRLAHAMKPLP